MLIDFLSTLEHLLFPLCPNFFCSFVCLAEDAFVFFREEMAQDIEAKIDAMRNVNIVATHIGPERTRDQLLPYLASKVSDPNSPNQSTMVLIELFVTFSHF